MARPQDPKINGWQDYGPYATFSADRKSIIIELIDGGDGDADGIANSVIVDPSGPAITSNETAGDGPNNDWGCFIETLLPLMDKF